MSLEDEVLVQNSMYQHVMQENEELKERIAALEAERDEAIRERNNLEVERNVYAVNYENAMNAMEIQTEQRVNVEKELKAAQTDLKRYQIENDVQEDTFARVENELVELNMAYQSCQSANEGLRDRLHELEELLKEYQALMAEIAVHVQVGAKRVGRIDALMQRAKELLGENK